MLKMQELNTIRHQVIDIARKAGQMMKQEAMTKIYEKEGHANFVTNMDLKIQKFIIEALEAVLPQAQVYAEEQENRTPEGYCWIIDPIDGTNNYIIDYHHSCVSIALLSEGEGILGVVYNPYLDEVFHAVKGGGAYVNEQPMQPADRPVNQSVIAFGTAPYHMELKQVTFAAAQEAFTQCADIRRSGSAALDICYVACGRTDGFFEYILSPWDYAAGGVIVKEAGAQIDAIPQETWRYDRPIGICAAAPHMWDTLMKILVEKLEEIE